MNYAQRVLDANKEFQNSDEWCTFSYSRGMQLLNICPYCFTARSILNETIFEKYTYFTLCLLFNHHCKNLVILHQELVIFY